MSPAVWLTWWGPSKLIMGSDVSRCQVNIRMSGFRLLYNCGWFSELEKCHQDSRCRPFSCSMVTLSNMLTYMQFSRNVPILQICPSDVQLLMHVMSFTRSSPTIMLLATNTGVRRTRYEAKFSHESEARINLPGIFWIIILSGVSMYSCSLPCPWLSPRSVWWSLSEVLAWSLSGCACLSASAQSSLSMIASTTSLQQPQNETHTDQCAWYTGSLVSTDQLSHSNHVSHSYFQLHFGWQIKCPRLPALCHQ